jgi:serine/threonine protein kinase
MQNPDGILLELAGRVADGEAIDWDEAESSADGDEHRKVVRRLRLLDGVSRVHRGQTVETATAASLAKTTVSGVPRGAAGGCGAPPPSRWGQMEIRERIGCGSFGEVYRAWDPSLDREVALKLLRPESSACADEGRLMARVRHPNVIKVLGAERHDDRVGIWMDLIQGRTLDEMLGEEGKLGGREAALIGLDLCRALAAIHGAGLVHRDIKTRNVMREDGGRILLMDFGAGRDLEKLREEEGEDHASISGTPLYMAPEVLLGEPTTARSDLYSLGVLLYRLVTGSYPVTARSMIELCEKHARRETRLLRDARSDLPESFVKAVERALAWDPDARHATAGEMAQALAAALGMQSGARAAGPGKKKHRRKRSPLLPWLAAAAAAVAVVAVFGWVALQDRKPPPSSTTAAAAYTIDVALLRTDSSGRRTSLDSGDRLELGDELTLEVKASRDVHVYVVNEDEAGRAYALFPLPDSQLRNPLPAGRTHLLPGKKDGKQRSWSVDSQGGREHLLVLASPERLVEFEEELAALPRPRPGQSAVELSERAKVRLRGIGGLVESEAPTPDGSAGRLFEMAEALAVPSERVRGVWMRHFELENP